MRNIKIVCYCFCLFQFCSCSEDEIEDRFKDLNESELGQEKAIPQLEDIKGLKVYRTPEGEVDSVLYYGTSEVMKLDKNDFVFRKELLFDRIEIDVPFKWEEIDSTLKYGIYTFAKSDSLHSMDFRPSFTVQRIEYKNSIEEFIQQNIDQLYYVYDSVQIHNVKRAEINSLLNVHILNFSMNSQGEKIGSVVVYFRGSDGYIYWFSGSGLNNYEEQIIPWIATYEEVYWSLKEK